MNTQPEALRLADELDRLESIGWGGDQADLTKYSEEQAELAAAELRRLHEENERLRINRMKSLAKLLDKTKRLHQVNQELVEALETIAEYWNQDTNHNPMQDACYYMEATARAALAKHKEN